jgi:hypothetical protein
MHLIQHDTISADSNKIEHVFQTNNAYRKARLDELVQATFDFLLVQEIDHLIVRSSFFRVYSTFIHFYQMDGEKSFVEWILNFNLNYNVLDLKNQYSFDDTNDIYQIMNQSYNNGIIYKEDYNGIIQDLLTLVSKQKIEVYKKAVIKGILFFKIIFK